MHDQTAWRSYLDQLCERGYVHIPGFLAQPALATVQAAVERSFEETPYGRDERTNAPMDSNRLVGLGEDVDLLSIFHMQSRELKSIPDGANLRAALDELLGKDFYLDRAVVRRARNRCGRFYFHKDQHGDIGLTVLLNDLGRGAGATLVRPERHLGTPPTLFCMPDINAEDPAEVEMTGRAGDAYLFYRDIDHSRAENRTDTSNIQLIFTFVNRNTVPAAHSRQSLGPGHLEELPETVRWMLRPYDGRPVDRHDGLVERLIYASGYSSPGAGDFDVRNDLVRDFLYNAFFVNGRPLRDKANGLLPRNTTRLNERLRVSPWRYLSHLPRRTALRHLVIQILRRTAGGRAAVAFLRRTIRPT